MGSLKLILAAAMVTSLSASLARAADLDALPVDPVREDTAQPVELGSGWYLRGDAAFAKDAMPKISSDLNFLPNTRNRNGWSAGLGGGFKFNNWFRADATYDYFSNYKANGVGGAITCPLSYTAGPPVVFNQQTCGVNQSTRVHRWATLANGYLDLGTWSGLSPYVGAGIGFSHMDTTGSVNYTNPDGSAYSKTLTNPTTLVTTTYKYDQTVRSRAYQVAWALMAGLTINIDQHASLDLGYRYLNLGTSKGVVASTGVIYSKSMIDQQFRAGIRYMID